MQAKIKVLLLHYKKLGLINLCIYLIQRKLTRTDRIIKIKVPRYSYPIYLRNNPSDTQIFTQIFLREELKVELPECPRVIIDGGANIGMATLYLKNRYPEATIFSVEPDKSNFAILKKNTEKYKDIFCYNNGIWNKKIRLTIENKNAGNESFIVKEANIDELNDDIIDAITIDDLVISNNIRKIDLLKLDIEGSECKVFYDNYKGWLALTENMIVEIHNWINKDAQKIVMTATEATYNCKMAGEYHFFTKK
jgi:FkbM family methyltransferase